MTSWPHESINIYVKLTKEFNQGKLRAIICSGQAVVLHRLAIMSKDGDWIVREDEEAIRHILEVLSDYNTHYRFGAPFDIRWLRGGWSSHFEFQYNTMRIRTDFLSRPPRISPLNLNRMWEEDKYSELPYVNKKDLAEIKKTNREKDYVIIGELARLMEDPREQLLYSRSARDLISLAEKYPQLIKDAGKQRPLLKEYTQGREKLEELLDAEKRALIHANERRLAHYMNAAENWSTLWPSLNKEIANKDLFQAHNTIVQRAIDILPFTPTGDNNDRNKR